MAIPRVKPDPNGKWIDLGRWESPKPKADAPKAPQPPAPPSK